MGAPRKGHLKLVPLPNGRLKLFSKRLPFTQHVPSFQKAPVVLITKPSNSWLDQVCSHMDAPKLGTPTKWSPNLFNNRLPLRNTSEFQRLPSAYQTARNNMVDQVCSHMIHPKEGQNKNGHLTLFSKRHCFTQHVRPLEKVLRVLPNSLQKRLVRCYLLSYEKAIVHNKPIK